MGPKRKKKLWRWLHKWPSLVLAVFLILWAISGVILNHRHIVSTLDVDRDYLPSEHRYKNWNNAAIRGSVRIDSNLNWFYGNVGVWEIDGRDSIWKDRRNGFPAGADHHKVNCLLVAENGKRFCGTRFGLYQYDQEVLIWNVIPIPHEDRHVVDLEQVGDSLWVMTRSHLWKIPLHGIPAFEYIPIPPPEGYDNKVGLFKTLWVIHSGEIYGIAGKLLVDFVALVFVFLTISGLIYFFFPRMMKHRKKHGKSATKLAFWNKFSIKWHNKIGVWLVILLIITIFTGMFLRPPLLIAIATSRVEKIPYSVLDDGNPWYDQLRRILLDKENNTVYLATSGGIYLLETSLKSRPGFIYPQPPASVMGYNVFEKHQNGNILVGSFSGLFQWNPAKGLIFDHYTGFTHTVQSGPAMPVSSNMTTGYHQDAIGREYVFDYNMGALPLRHSKDFAKMPETISEANMPLWNIALEWHTARLLKPIIGNFYLLFIPLFGLFALMIMISGTVLWVRKYRRKSK